MTEPVSGIGGMRGISGGESRGGGRQSGGQKRGGGGPTEDRVDISAEARAKKEQPRKGLLRTLLEIFGFVPR